MMHSLHVAYRQPTETCSGSNVLTSRATLKMAIVEQAVERRCPYSGVPLDGSNLLRNMTLA
jgi:hypothetical protein